MKKGFTLIELLIVIAILGILATVLLAAIDPLEQFRKATDAGRLSKLREIAAAAQRYGANTGSMLPATGSESGTTGPLTALNDSTLGILPTLVASGELKASMTTNTADIATMYYGRAYGDNSQYAFCFAPTSKANITNNAKYALTTEIPNEGAIIEAEEDATLQCLY